MEKNCNISSRTVHFVAAHKKPVQWFRNKLDSAGRHRTRIMLQPKNQIKLVKALGTILLSRQEQTSATKGAPKYIYLLCSMFTLVDTDDAIDKETRPWNKG
jgi:hypothetical protein